MFQRTAPGTTDDLRGPSSLDRARSAPPRPTAAPVTRTLFGESVPLPYRWMRDRTNPELAEHLAAENTFTDQQTAHLHDRYVRFSLARRVPPPSPVSLSVPVQVDDWWYIDRPGIDSAPSFTRVRDRAELRGPAGVPVIVPGRLLEGEEVLIEDCTMTVNVAISPDHRLLAHAEARLDGCLLQLIDTTTGRRIDEEIPGAGPDQVFSADSRSVIYTHLDADGRAHQVRRHRLGTPISQDAVLLREADEWAEFSLARSRDGSSLVIRAHSPMAAETWLADLRDLESEPRSVTGRLDDDTTRIEHAGDRLLVLQEQLGSHRSLLGESALPSTGGLPGVTPLLTGGPDEQFESVEAFADFVALQVRSEGLPQLRIIPRRPDGSLDTDAVQVMGRGGVLDAVRMGRMPLWHQRTVRYRVDSFLTPSTVIDHDLDSGTSTVVMRSPAPGIALDRFVERRLWAESADGTRVPISLIARHDVPADGTAACLLYADGAFGESTDPFLNPESLALADLGVVVAVAHVRGGGELGRRWHARGRGPRKMNSVDDFVACADHLIASGWSSATRLGTVGTGTGGLLVGAAANHAPSLFRAVMAGAPLADHLECMLDPTTELTLEEWAEWGDPVTDESIYRAMRRYSPAESVPRSEYPAVFAWGVLEGAPASPSSAAIWVARLRDTVTSDLEERPVLLRTAPTLGSADAPWIEGLVFLMDQLGVDTLGE